MNVPQKLKYLCWGVAYSIAFLNFAPSNVMALEINSSDTNQELLNFKIPELPNLGDSSLYLPSTQELFDVKVIIRLSQRKVYVYQQDQEVASFPIAVGKKGWETPKGNFSVISMVESPSWQNPWTGKVIPSGEGNPLGDRWIGFWTDGTNSIGFHGTPGEHLIGQAVSHGCVRMKNKDVRSLFDLVTVGTTVLVQP